MLVRTHPTWPSTSATLQPGTQCAQPLLSVSAAGERSVQKCIDLGKQCRQQQVL
jgi:hypothetical protein